MVSQKLQNSYDAILFQDLRSLWIYCKATTFLDVFCNFREVLEAFISLPKELHKSDSIYRASQSHQISCKGQLRSVYLYHWSIKANYLCEDSFRSFKLSNCSIYLVFRKENHNVSLLSPQTRLDFRKTIFLVDLSPIIIYWI